MDGLLIEFANEMPQDMNHLVPMTASHRSSVRPSPNAREPWTKVVAALSRLKTVERLRRHDQPRALGIAIKKFLGRQHRDNFGSRPRESGSPV